MRYGIIAGGFSISLFAICYFIDRELVLQRWLWLGSFAIYLFAMWQAQSKVVGDEFKDLIQPGFLVFIIANAIFYVYYHLLFAAFDPELVDLQAKMLEAAGQDPKDAKVPTWGGTFFSYVQSLMGGFALAAIIAVFIRFQKNR